MRRRRIAAAAVLLGLAGAAEPAWDPAPWLADLAQAEGAVRERYANLEWLEGERGVALAPLVGRAAAALRGAGSDAGARAVMDRFVQRFRDGHVRLDWPRGPSDPGGARRPTTAERPTPASFCAGLGYRTVRSTGTARALAGYAPVSGGGPFAAGTVPAAGGTLGVVEVPVFSPEGYPALCEAAVAATRARVDRPCDEECRDRIVTRAFADMTRAFAAAVARVRAAGATVLMVDLTGNGGGSEWAEAAARMLSTRPLRSAELGYVRGAHWSANWRRTADALRPYLRRARGAERAELTRYVALAEAAAAPCAPGRACPRIARAGGAVGLVREARSGAFSGRDWGVHVFNPAQFPYRDGVWDGPAIVLVDAETWSAAEQFAALLRDNDAAVVMGERTGGAGCGYTWGGTPVRLANSGAVLRLPDCVRFRRDGSNEVSGVVPDVPTGARADDGRALAARLTGARLGEAMRAARAMYAAR